VLVIDKPAAISSSQALGRIKKILTPGRIGHTGALDPFATGALILLLNQATRLAAVFGAAPKAYCGLLQLGASTDSGDYTGQILENKPVPKLSRPLVEAQMAKMVGPQLQSPPMFSAAKYQGRPLYHYARQGIAIAKPPRPVEVFAARLLELGQDFLTFRLTTGSGVYVRSWAAELAQALGSAGHLRRLRREANGPFGESSFLALDEAAELSAAELAARVLAVDDALNLLGVPAIYVDDDMSWRLRQGVVFRKDNFADPPEVGLAYVLNRKNRELVTVLNFWAQARNDRDYEVVRVFNPDGAEA
jgi:tRNA pseudouridine55 synthase